VYRDGRPLDSPTKKGLVINRRSKNVVDVGLDGVLGPVVLIEAKVGPDEYSRVARHERRERA
jgi:hypothetical protein